MNRCSIGSGYDYPERMSMLHWPTPTGLLVVGWVQAYKSSPSLRFPVTSGGLASPTRLRTKITTACASFQDLPVLNPHASWLLVAGADLRLVVATVTGFPCNTLNDVLVHDSTTGTSPAAHQPAHSPTRLKTAPLYDG